MNGKNLGLPAFALVLASSLLAPPASAQTAPGAAKPGTTAVAPAAATDVKSDALSIMRYSEDGGGAIRH